MSSCSLLSISGTGPETEGTLFTGLDQQEGEDEENGNDDLTTVTIHSSSDTRRDTRDWYSDNKRVERGRTEERRE